MEKKGFWSRLVSTIFDHNTFRMVLLVVVVLRTCAFLNPIVGPLVKFTLLWSACILVKDLFTDRLFMVNRYRGILYLFLISYAITCLVTVSYTHLDVYKRQIFQGDRQIRSRDGPRLLPFHERCRG